MVVIRHQKVIDSAIKIKNKNLLKRSRTAVHPEEFLRLGKFSGGIDSFSVGHQTKKEKSFDYSSARFVRKYKNASTLFSKYGKTKNFSTNNLELHLIKSDLQPNFASLDGFLSFEKKIPLHYAVKNRAQLLETIRKRYGSYKNYCQEAFVHPFESMSTVKMWNVSIVGSLVVGMFLMTFIYRYLGQGAAAVSISSNMETTTQEVLDSQKATVLGAATKNEYNPGDSTQVENYVSQIMKDYQDKSGNTKQLEKEIYAMVGDTPMKQMVPYIAQQDRMVAAFMVGIARQESSWGVHVPVDDDGNDCYNYWGYRGKRAKMGTGGHTCFNSPKDAVETVAKRLKFLVSNEKMTTPGKMVVVWKCGYDCSWDKSENVTRWVDAVNYYFKQFHE